MAPTLNLSGQQTRNQHTTMEATLIIPAAFVQYLRSGLMGEWGYAAEQLSNLALQFGGNAPDGAYGEPLQVFDIIRILLGEIGWKDTDGQADVVINLYIGGAYVVKGLKHEQMMLAEQLNEMPKRTRKAMRDVATAEVTAFGEFVKSVESDLSRLGGHPSPPDHARPTLRAQLPRVRQQQH